MRSRGLRPWATAAAIVVGLLLAPVVLLGVSTATVWYSDWLAVNASHAEAILDLRSVAVNLGLPSLLYQRFGWSVAAVGVLSLAGLLALHVAALQSRSPLGTYCLGSVGVFVLSPAAFPYSFMGLMLPAVVALRQSLRPGEVRARVLVAGYFLSNSVLTASILGRGPYNAIVVPWRLQGLCVLALLPFFFPWRQRELAPLVVSDPVV